MGSGRRPHLAITRVLDERTDAVNGAVLLTVWSAGRRYFRTVTGLSAQKPNSSGRNGGKRDMSIRNCLW
jgi:hypothetical protein